MSDARTEERYVSTDGELVFLVIYDRGDYTMGFKGSVWHTHGDILPGRPGPSIADDVRRYVADLLNDRSVIAIEDFDGEPLISIEEPELEKAIGPSDPSTRRRYWSGKVPAPL
ncbi:hypothetical protein EON80_18710 [bacterium]|nr:MAG: hypothetical protein EON80_18710 [bacterium]